MTFYEILLILSSTILFILSDSLAANWSKNNSLISLFILLAIAPVGYVFFGLLNRDRTLATSSGIVNVALLIGTILISIFYFHEGITIRQGIGFIFAMISMYLLV